MASSFFDKIKLFKGAEIQPGRPPAEPSEEEKSQPFLEKLIQGPWLILAFTSLIMAVGLTNLPPRSLSTLASGAVAPADIVAPFDLIIEDDGATAKKKEEAAAAILPVYTYDANTFANTEDKVRALFAAGRDWTARFPENHRSAELRSALLDKFGVDLEPADVTTLARAKFPAELEEALVTLLAKTFNRGIILSKNLFIHGETERGLTLLDLRGVERTMRVGDLLDLAESERHFADDLEKIVIPARDKALLSNLGQIFLSANVTYNKIETEGRKARAQGEIGTVTFLVKKDRVIVRKGDEVTADALRILDQYNQRIARRSHWLPTFAGILVLYLVLLGTLWSYLRAAFKPAPADRQYRMTAAGLVGSLLIFKIFILLATTVSGAVTIPPSPASRPTLTPSPTRSGRSSSPSSSPT